jgi:hypothetical protein
MAAFLPNAKSIVIESCDTFDHRFDAFWGKLKAQNPGRLLPVRTSEVLSWHFASALRENRLWIATTTDESGITAFATFVRRGDTTSGLSRVLFVDFQFVDRNAQVLVAMLSWALQRCRRENVHLLENLGLHLGTTNIAQLPTYVRQRGAWSYVYKANDPNFAALLRNPIVWAPSAFDGDITL